jgi:SAM-dependent methyltransferase
LLREIPLHIGMRVLDIGCGTGSSTLALELAERLGSDSTVVGLDPWHNVLERGRAKASSYLVSTTEFVHADGETMPLVDRSFDLVVCNLGLDNWTAPGNTIASISRVLKRNGTFGCTTNPRGHWREFHEIVRDTLKNQGQADAISRWDQQEALRLDLGRALPLFEAVDLFIERRVPETLVFRFAQAKAFLNHHFVRWGFKGAWVNALGAELWKKVEPEVIERLDALPHDNGAIRLVAPMEYWEFVKRR